MAGPTSTTPKLWLKADAGVYHDLGSTLATNGQTWRQWNDQSGNGNHCTRPSAASVGTYSTSGVGAVGFDGSSDSLTNPFASVPLTAFFVITPDASQTQTNPSVCGNGSSAGTNHWAYLVRILGADYTADSLSLQMAARVTSLNDTGLGSGIQDAQAVTPVLLGNKYVLCVRITSDSAGGWIQIFVNGALQSQAEIAGTPRTANSLAVIGGFIFSGAVAGNSWYKGSMHEVLMYDSTLTDAETQLVHDYLLPRHSVTAYYRATTQKYIYVQFQGDDPSTQQLSVLTSQDLSSFTAFNSSYYPTTPFIVRDPGVVLWNGTRYLNHTISAYSAGTSPYPFTATSTIGVASFSSDWKTVTQLPSCDFSLLGTISYCWGSKWFKDSNNDLYLQASIFLAASPSDSKLYRCKVTDIVAGTYSAPVEVVITSRPSDVSEFHTVLVGSTYHIFYSAISGGFIGHATSSTLTGTYSIVGTGDWAGWRASIKSQLGLGSDPYIEGTSVVLLSDNVTYRIFFDAYNPGRYGLWYSDSTDLTTWSTPARVLPPWQQATRNGSIIIADSITTVNQACQYLWNLRQKIANANQCVWNIRNCINNSDQVLWNIRSKINNSGQFVWNLRSCANNSVNESWNLRQLANSSNQCLWHVRNCINNSGQFPWNIRKSINSSDQILWNIRQLANNNNQCIWNVRSCVSNCDQIVWNLRQGIISCDQILWNVRQCANNSTNIAWDVRQLCNSSDQILWNVRQLCNSAEQALWHLRQCVTNSDQISWNVRNCINSGEQLVWNLRQLANSSEQIVWNVLSNVATSTANNAVQIVWNLRQCVNTADKLVWNLRQCVNNSDQIVWNDKQCVNSSDSINWNVLNRVNSADQFLWNVLKGVSNSDQFLWNLRQCSNSSTGVAWNLRQLANNADNIVWNDLQRVNGSAIQIKWDVRILVGSAEACLWNIRKSIPAGFSGVWNVRACVNNGEQFRWNVLQRATNANKVVWNLNQSVQPKAFSTFWNIRANVVNGVLVKWNVESFLATFGIYKDFDFQIVRELDFDFIIKNDVPIEFGITDDILDDFTFHYKYEEN